MNVIYAVAAYPFGRLADATSRTHLLGLGLVVLTAADAALALSNHLGWARAGITLRGLHIAMTQGLLAAMIADIAPEDLRGTACGFFNLMSRLAMLFAAGLAGFLWDEFGTSWTFIAGIGFCIAALVVIAGSPHDFGTYLHAVPR